MIKLLKYLKGSAVVCAILAPLAMCLEVAMDLLQPTLLSNIIDIGVANGDLNYVLVVGIKMVIVAVIGLFAGAACSYLAAVASMKLGEGVREGLFNKIQTLSFLELDKLKTSSLITRLTNDVTQLQMMMNMSLRMMVRAPLTAIGGLVMAIILSKQLASIFIVALPIILVSILFIIKKSLPLFTSVQQRIDNINTVMRESILGVKVIKAFAIEKTQGERFNEANDNLTNESIASQNMNLILWPIATLIMNLTVVAVLWFGGNMVNNGDLEIGKIMAFINYLLQIMGSVVMVINIMLTFSRASASATRINEVFETESSIKDKEDNVDVENFDIEFKNVYFRYNEHSENVLEDISFKAKQGETIGIIGSTGCGKSSFVNLIPRLYDATEGEILIGGTNIKNIKLNHLRDNIGIVLQESILFGGTIESNLRFGKNDANNLDMESSAKDAQAYEFIMNKENTYKSEVEQRGKNLSGGQKQRLSIARTLIRDPKIFIMDDSSSALDMATEAKLQNSIKNRMKDSTVLVIAQRISGVMDADKIIVMDDGRISDIGTHDELLRRNDIYRSIAVSQLGEEVLKVV
ncbi:ABC transporter ATP-binding protein [Romboutsia sp. 1001713B170207_170306_H8]|uniref:ABC transporter ATP-binding protein n=1 Tax=Romboutsia sp. 1001713B170207_170306_H8 TaxID=2787112 RepID=UPI0008207F62|nr:ABC transporter ATP-binding protein [Romboutsia sp. 1001713B170207_170306_H8]SCH18180.1 Putative multidrug export ATP-binding/permease protein SAV1866 [uncultured Clostridium sp.]